MSINCETQNGITPPDNNVAELVTAGWEQFEAGNYQSALEKFESQFIELEKTCLNWDYFKRILVDDSLNQIEPNPDVFLIERII